MNPLPLFSASLKDGDAAPIIASLLAEAKADVIMNMTSFAVSDPAAAADGMPGLASVGPLARLTRRCCSLFWQQAGSRTGPGPPPA